MFVLSLRRALARVNADPNGSNTAFWTSLREVGASVLACGTTLTPYFFYQEPVLYVAGRPHVLRLDDRPLENVECVII